jgi:hypothetical protein
LAKPRLKLQLLNTKSVAINVALASSNTINSWYLSFIPNSTAKLSLNVSAEYVEQGKCGIFAQSTLQISIC